MFTRRSEGLSHNDVSRFDSCLDVWHISKLQSLSYATDGLEKVPLIGSYFLDVASLDLATSHLYLDGTSTAQHADDNFLVPGGGLTTRARCTSWNKQVRHQSLCGSPLSVLLRARPIEE
jgi:hypothetical protein